MLDAIRQQIAGLSEPDRARLLNEMLVAYLRTLDGERLIADERDQPVGVLTPFVDGCAPLPFGEALLEYARRQPRRPLKDVLADLEARVAAGDTVASQAR